MLVIPPGILHPWLIVAQLRVDHVLLVPQSRIYLLYVRLFIFCVFVCIVMYCILYRKGVTNCATNSLCAHRFGIYYTAYALCMLTHVQTCTLN